MNQIVQNMHLVSDTELRVILIIANATDVLSVLDLQNMTNRGRHVYTALQSLKERGIVVQSNPQLIDGVRKYQWRCIWVETPKNQKQSSSSERKAPVSKKKTSNPNQSNDAVLAYMELTSRRPKQLAADAIAASVSVEETELSRWKSIVKSWILSGWNPNNVDGMIDMYNKRQLPVDNRRKRVISLNPPEKTESEMNAMLSEYLKDNEVFNEEN